MIAVIDYEAGNLKSVETALKYLGAEFRITDEPGEVLKADKVIFPGVGEARSAMNNLEKRGLGTALKSFVSTGKYLLGICLGSHIILDSSEENSTKCLGIIPGKARKFPDNISIKIPQIGWNTVKYNEHILFKGIPQERSFYFVHSYYLEPASDEYVIGMSEYGIDFCSVIGYENIMATQFHPEKSGKWGLKMLSNFIELE